MKVDGGLPFELERAADAAREAEGRSYDAVWSVEAVQTKPRLRCTTELSERHGSGGST